MAHISLEASGYLGTATRDNTEMQDELDAVSDVLRDVGGAGQNVPTVTLSLGIASPATQPGFFRIAMEGGASSDQLDGIATANYGDDAVITFFLSTVTDSLTVKNASGSGGQIFTISGADVVVTSQWEGMTLRRFGSSNYWIEIIPHGRSAHIKSTYSLLGATDQAADSAQLGGVAAAQYVRKNDTGAQVVAGSFRAIDSSAVEAKSGTNITRFDLREYNGGAQRLRTRLKWDETNEFYQIDAFNGSATVTAALRVDPVNKRVGVFDDAGAGPQFYAARPASPSNGDIWLEGTNLRCYTGGVEKSLTDI